MSLPKEVEASYAAIIDSILATSDLNTVSEKRIRKGLQAKVQYDLTPQKASTTAPADPDRRKLTRCVTQAQIKELIMARFDKFNAENPVTPSSPEKSPAMAAMAQTNGHAVKRESEFKSESAEPMQEATPPTSGTRRREDDDDEAMSDVIDGPHRPNSKKKRKVVAEDDDAAMAAQLQAEEWKQKRATRGGVVKKAGPIRKKKRVSRAKAEGNDESGSGSEAKRKVNRSGGFHKPMTLSTPLAEFLGVSMAPRTEVVKKIWEYVREHDLQDPKDRRQIRCDDALKAVFKQDRVHMFTMNKILTSHVFSPGE
ncbi:MAG: hypothetical protein M1832_000408 [Thelocarpon impressellum]|nr:MAG: hypothetical protein M1832_000408 [Thelocarpon impressellum]